MCWYEDIVYMDCGHYVRTTIQCPHQSDKYRGEETWLSECPNVRLYVCVLQRVTGGVESVTRGWKSQSITMLLNVNTVPVVISGTISRIQIHNTRHTCSQTYWQCWQGQKYALSFKSRRPFQTLLWWRRLRRRWLSNSYLVWMGGVECQ
jgi:hypothetical protein